MFWLIAVLISIISLCISRFERIGAFFSFLALGISMGTPNYVTNGDAIVYANNYMLQTHEFEVGYNFISDFFGKYCDYSTFRLITSILFCLILYISVSLITKKIAVFSLLYCICAFPYDTLQVRSEMALSLIILGCAFLFKYQNKGIIYSFVIIYLASLFHSIALIFLFIPILYPFVSFFVKKRTVLFFMLGLISIIARLIGTTNIGSFITQLVSKYSTRDNAAQNTSQVYSFGTSWFIWIIVFIFTILLITYVMNQNYDCMNKDVKSIYKILVLALMIWMFGLVLFSISVDYIRILRIVTLVFFIFTCSELQSYRIRNQKYIIVYDLFLAFILFFIQMELYGLSINNVLSNMNL